MLGHPLQGVKYGRPMPRETMAKNHKDARKEQPLKQRLYNPWLDEGPKDRSPNSARRCNVSEDIPSLVDLI
jgi:hypothetical protein